MRLIPAALQTHLDGRTTTLCRCFKLTLSNDDVLGFTDHDRILSFDSVSYNPQDGYSVTTYQQRIGLSVDTVDVSAALSSTSLTQEDLDKGLYDGATLEIFIVNWQAVSQRFTLFKGIAGDVKRNKLQFEAEIRSEVHKLNQPQGRTYSRLCDAVLGDSRCTKNIAVSPFSENGSVDSIVDNQNFTVTGFTQDETGWFDVGKLLFTGGMNAGLMFDIKSHTVSAGDHVIKLWQRPPFDVTAADTVTLTAGCKKDFAACQEKFENEINFQGFLYIPNPDLAIKPLNRIDESGSASDAIIASLNPFNFF